MLTDQELAGMRATELASLPDLCDVMRSTRQADGKGGQTTVWAAVTEDLLCRLSPNAQGAGNESVIGAKLTAESDWVLTLAWDQLPTVKDRIRMGSRTFEIKGVAGPRSYQICLRVGLTEIT